MVDAPIANVPPPMNINTGLGLPNGASPKIIPLNVNLTVNQSVLVDLTQQQQNNNIGPIQTIYINNSNNLQPVTVTAQVSNISYTILAGDSAILPFFLPNQAPKFIVASTGGVQLGIAVLDTPQPAQVWGASTGAGFNFTAGKLQVTDVALDALITNLSSQGNGLAVYDLGLNNLISNLGPGNALDVNVLSGGGGGTSAAQIIQNGIFNSGTGLIDTSNPSPKSWLVTAIKVTMSPDAVFASGGAQSFTLSNPGGGQILARWGFTAPSSAGSGVTDIPILDEVFDNPLTNGVHDVVRGSFSVAMTGGRVYYTLHAYQG